MGVCEECGERIIFMASCHICPTIRNKKKIQKNINIKKIENKGNVSQYIDIIKLLIIKDINDIKEYNKVKEHIENHFFNKDIINKENNIIIYKDINYRLEVTAIDFNDLYIYSKNEYDFIISFLNNINNNIRIIKTFKKCKYMMKKLCSKEEIISICSEYINAIDLLLTNHFRKEINKILSWDSINNPVSISTISKSSKNSIDTINKLKIDLAEQSGSESTYENCLICPISHEIMKEPVITPYGHTFEKENILKIIEKNGKCPITRKKLEEKDLIPNFALKNVIEQYNQK